MPTSCHRGRTPPALGACVRHAIGEFAGQRNTSVMPRPDPFDHDNEQHPLSATSPAGVASAEPDGVNMDRLLTADELAERLGMKTEWVWAQAGAGRIPHVRLGRYRRFRESAVETWLRELETGGPATPQSRPITLRRRA